VVAAVKPVLATTANAAATISARRDGEFDGLAIVVYWLFDQIILACAMGVRQTVS
jgi:hypothetical protein